MSGKIRGNTYRRTVVCIDNYEDQILCGRFYNAFQQEGVRFNGLMDFLLRMEHMLDGMDFPQAFSAVRSFAIPVEPATTDPPEERLPLGAQATFEVKILFRQNTSWQGCLTWLETGQEASFRSVLELVILMDSALTDTTAGERAPA